MDDIESKYIEEELEKVVSLLREFKPLAFDYVVHKGSIADWKTDDEGEINYYTDISAIIISKKFGFVEWLIKKKYLRPDDDFQNIYSSGSSGEWEFKRNAYEKALMRLSIQDNPLWFMCRNLWLDEN